jgi:hypothetical protein
MLEEITLGRPCGLWSLRGWRRPDPRTVNPQHIALEVRERRRLEQQQSILDSSL